MLIKAFIMKYGIIIKLVITLINFKSIRCNDVLGCGGFVKSHVQIDFSKIEVELYTQQGILKDKTSCAPNNGYYFIPLYDKGDYVLQVRPPPGWSINPTKVSLTIDGRTDLCSEGKDINFIFNGFGITGNVETFNRKIGPAGINVQLKSNKDIRKTVTSTDGRFFFTPVYPGNYVVSITHDKWKLLKDEFAVKVTEGNTELPSGSLIVAGYDVTGSIQKDKAKINVYLILFKSDNEDQIFISDCIQQILKIKHKSKQLCHIKSSNDGSFKFPVISNGKYSIIPYLENIHFKPSFIDFEVQHNSVILPETFKIIGYSVSGHVLMSKNGAPLANAKIFLNRNEIAVTNSNGIYSLDKIKADSYQIDVQAENLEFEEKLVIVDFNALSLPDLFPSKYKVCGKVLSNKSQTIIITTINSTNIVITKSLPSDGKFCQFLSPGKYQIHVSISDTEKGQGIQFFPISHFVDVISYPVYGIIFSQLKAVVSGKLNCIKIEDCLSLKVMLKATVSDTSLNYQPIITDVIDNSYSFNEVGPGDYEISLLPNKLCWNVDKHIVSINAAVEEIPIFIQNGYAVNFISSHSTEVTYETKQSEKQSLKLQKGKTKHCVEKPGSYEFTLGSCHTYENNKIMFNTTNELNEIHLTAEKHTVTIAIEAEMYFDNVYIIVNMGGYKTKEGSLPYVKNYYILTLLLQPDESAILIPESDILYFDPPILSIVGHEDCTDLGVKFIATKGKVFQGKVVPPLEGVLVTIETENSEALMDITNSEGKYKFPPQDSSKNYKISAKKDTYILLGPDENGDFVAHKLAEIIVEVVDEKDQLPLQGALLSLSGGESYRSNLQTNKDGKISFHSLSPSQYFLRPMMKEYNFEPNSKIIDITEGVTINIKLRGKKVAYSCFGQVISLNGEAEEEITITALGNNNCSHLSEEATSEQNGKFRIRGLQPYCSYNVNVKSSSDDKRSVERTIPSLFNVTIKDNDIFNLKFMVLKQTSNTDILVHVYSENPIHYKTLKLKIMRESPVSSLIHNILVDNSNYKITKDNNVGVFVQIPSVPTDNKSYSVHLEAASLTNSKLKLNSHYFTTNSPFKYIKLEYSTKTNIAEQSIKQTSLWTLILIIGFLLLGYNIEQWSQIVKNQLSRININSLINIQKNSSNNDYVIDQNEIDQIVQSINATKRKVKPKKL